MARGAARVRGIEVAYDDEGRGEALVLLHGFPFDRSMWREQSKFLSVTCRVIAPDLRGLGETPLGDAGAATMDEMAEDVAALLDALGVERAVLGGLSMGGYVALEFFRRFPRRVRALVLADTRPQADTDDARRTREENAQKVLREGMAPLVDSMLPELLSEIDVPTLVIVGVEDTITPPSDAEALAAKIAGSRLVRIDGAAHLS